MLPGEWPVSSIMVGYNASYSHSYCHFLKYLFNSELPFKQSSTILMSQCIRKYTINEILRKFKYLFLKKKTTKTLYFIVYVNRLFLLSRSFVRGPTG